MQREIRGAGFSDLPAPFTFLRTLLMACEFSLRRSAAAPVVAPVSSAAAPVVAPSSYSHALCCLSGVSTSVWVSFTVPEGEETSLIILPSGASLTLPKLRWDICVWMRTATCLNAMTVFLYKHRNAGGPYLDGGDGLFEWTDFANPGGNLRVG